ncbi:sensor histidine kinase [Flavobacterium kingsejongi]|uniref:histidine kinase n=1 Tax=Flavobacterium kingsejongi TaxID=1678728 RepID=A0A2S1LKL7_9FLAO|nr:ATP-binding protein [Flavobacterium kingsejongi]AWG24231.1 hypothetical protein FK004_02835 [Flavobacterium kingsejongi]
MILKKFYSPFAILAILICCISCSKESHFFTSTNNSYADSASIYLDSAYADSQIKTALPLYTIAKKYAQKANDKNILFDILFKKTNALIDSSDSIAAKQNLELYIHMADSSSELRYVSKGKLLSGNFDVMIGDLKKASKEYYDAKLGFEKVEDHEMLIYTLLKIANIHYFYNDFIEMEDASTEALKYTNSKTEISYLKSIYNYLGISYKKIYDYKIAKDYYKKNRQLSEDTINKAIADNNIATVYIAEKKYDSAEIILAPHLQEKIKLSTIAKIKDNYGYALYKQEKKGGLEQMLEALKIRQQDDDQNGLIAGNFHLAEYYEKSDRILALQYALQSYQAAQRIKSVDGKIEALDIMIHNNPENAYTYHIEYAHLNDSIKGVRQKAKNAFAKAKYDFQKEKIEKERQEKMFLITVSIAGPLIVSIILLSLFLSYRKNTKHKQEKIHESYKTETRLSKKVHDELANDLFNVMNFASNQDLAVDEKKETLLQNLENVYKRTRNISRENSTIDTGEAFAANLKSMISEYNTPERNVLINGIDSIPWNEIEENKKIITFRVLQELMVNMKKYSQATLTVIGFKNIDKKIQVNYSDNGVGMDADALSRKNGLRNVENRIESIGGTFTFDPVPPKGLKVSFVYPI